MKFKVKPKPCFYDKKIVVKFAWFPKRIEDTIVWLEEYLVVYRYEKDWFWGYYYWGVYKTELLNKQE